MSHRAVDLSRIAGRISVASRVASRTHQAAINLDARRLFFYVPLPPDVASELNSMRSDFAPPDSAVEQDLDHLTLLFIPKSETPIDPATVDLILNAAREVGASVGPIQAKVQGWGYFDGAKKDGEDKTALVAMIDAPGLEDLHVRLKDAVRELGWPDAGTHSFVPHATFTYLEPGGRVDGLPVLTGQFTIDRFMLANSAAHEILLGV